MKLLYPRDSMIPEIRSKMLFYLVESQDCISLYEVFSPTRTQHRQTRRESLFYN
jgi:hypothetical protein